MADVDNRNRNRRSNRAGQPNPKREARAKAAERHVATVSEACAKDIERSLAGVREFDGMPAGFVSAMKAKVQSAVATEEQVAEDVEGAEAAEVEAALEPVEEPAEEIAEAESAPAEEPAPVLPEVTVLDASTTQAILDNGRGYAQFCDMAVLAFASFTNPGGGYIQGYLGQEARCAPIRICTTFSISSANGTARTVAATSTASFTETVRWWCLRCASTATTCMHTPT